MRSPHHMSRLLIASLAAGVALSPSEPARVVPRESKPPRTESELERHARQVGGKPPMNGNREVQRRLRQMQRKAQKARP